MEGVIIHGMAFIFIHDAVSSPLPPSLPSPRLSPAWCSKNLMMGALGATSPLVK